MVAVARVAGEMGEVMVAVVTGAGARVVELAAAMEARAVERAATAALGSRRRSPDSDSLPRRCTLCIPGR